MNQGYNPTLEECIQEQREFLRHPIDKDHNYVHVWRRQYIASLLQLYLEDIQFKKKLLNDKKLKEEILQGIKVQVIKERENQQKIYQEFQRSEQEYKKTNDQKKVILYKEVFDFIKTQRDAIFAMMERMGNRIDIELFDRLMDVLNWDILEALLTPKKGGRSNEIQVKDEKKEQDKQEVKKEQQSKQEEKKEQAKEADFKELESIIKELIQFLNHRPVKYIHRSERDCIAYYLELFLEDIKYKERLLNEHQSIDDLIQGIGKQLDSEKEKSILKEKELKENQKELQERSKKLRSFFKIIIELIRRQKDAFYTFLLRQGHTIPLADFDRYINDDNWIEMVLMSLMNQ
jgi:hypothetical protein